MSSEIKYLTVYFRIVINSADSSCRFPDDRWLIELKINHELAPARDLQGIIKVIDSFYSTESNKDSDNVEVIVGAQEACERADWKQGARALLEEYTNGKFAKSEVGLVCI